MQWMKLFLSQVVWRVYGSLSSWKKKKVHRYFVCMYTFIFFTSFELAFYIQRLQYRLVVFTTITKRVNNNYSIDMLPLQSYYCILFYLLTAGGYHNIRIWLDKFILSFSRIIIMHVRELTKRQSICTLCTPNSLVSSATYSLLMTNY